MILNLIYFESIFEIISIGFERLIDDNLVITNARNLPFDANECKYVHY